MSQFGIHLPTHRDVESSVAHNRQNEHTAGDFVIAQNRQLRNDATNLERRCVRIVGETTAYQ